MMEAWQASSQTWFEGDAQKVGRHIEKQQAWALKEKSDPKYLAGRQNLGIEEKQGKLGMEKIDVMDNL